MINSELFKNSVKFLTTIITLVDKLVESFGPLSIIIPSLLAIGSNKGWELPSNFGNGLIKKFKKAYSYVRNIKKDLNEPIDTTVKTKVEVDSKEAKKIGTITTSAIAGIISIVLNVALKTYEKYVNKTLELQNKISDDITKYENNKTELENINSQLEENQKRIEEINNNNLKIINNEELKKLETANDKLLQTKTILEQANKTQELLVQSQIKQLLNSKDYYITSKGILTGKEGQDTLTDDIVSNGFQMVSDFYGRGVYTDRNNINNPYYSSKTGQKYNEIYQSLDVLGLTKYFSGLLMTGFSSKGLSSDLISQTEKLLDEYHNLITNNNPYTTYLTPGKDGHSLEEYEINRNRIQEIESSFVDINTQLSGYLQYLPETSEEYKKISEILKSIENKVSYYDNAPSESYTVKLFEKYSSQYDNFSIGYTDYKKRKDNGKTTDEDLPYIQYDKQLTAYNELFKSGLLNEVTSTSYLQKLEDINNLKVFDDIKLMAKDIFKELYSEYQTPEDRFKQYYKENPNIIRSIMSPYLNGYSKKISISPEDLEKLGPAFEAFGADIDNACYYIQKLADSIIEERFKLLQGKTEQAQIDFNENKTDFDENFVSTQTTFTNAISNIANGSSISYEDMWALVGIDPTLVDKFTKSTDGYTISIENLIDAQNRYKQETKDTFKTAIEDSQERIAEYQNKIKDTEDKLNDAYDELEKNGPSNIGNIKKLKETIDECNKGIDEENELLAKNTLMYEEVSNSTSVYINHLETAASKLSTFKSLYESLIKDMSMMGRIGAESMIELINTFPDNWQQLITQTENGFTLNEDAYTQTVIQKLGFSGADEKTIINDLNNDIGDKLKDLAEKYNLVYAKGKPLEIQFNDIRQQAKNAGVDSAEFTSEIDALGKEFEGVSETAAAFAEIIARLIGSFKENKALTGFNASIEKLQFGLETGQINQAQYDKQYIEAVKEFRNKAYENGTIDDPETQSQLMSMATNIISAQQSRYQKELDTKTQNLQDAYEQRLISAKDYYDQLKKLEDEYYGTETTAGKLHDPDQANVDNKNRTQLERRATLANDEFVTLQAEYTRGLKGFDQVEAEIKNSLDYWLGDTKELAQQYKDLSREVSSFLYESEVTLADKQLEQGLMSNTKYAKEMLRVWKKYYKDKEGYSEESYQAEQKFMSAAKSSVQNYIDGIENLMSQNEDFINTQIDALEEQNEEIEKDYDTQIQAIEEQIDAIDKKNDEEERHLELLKAEEALEKAKRNKRLVFDSMGNQQYRPDTQSIKEAQDELDKVKREEEKQKLQDEIDRLEKEKQEKLDENNKKIEELNTQLKTLNKPLEDLAAVLAYNLAETYDIDPEVIKDLLSSEASQEKMGKINEARKATGQEELTTKGLKQTANDASKQNNQLTDTATKNNDIAVAYGGSYTVNGNLHGIQTTSDNKSQAQEVSVLSIDGVNYKVIADSVSSIDSNLSELLDSPVNWNFNPGETMYATSAASAVVPNVSTNQLSVSIGDININNPVGDSMNLAQEISKQLPNAFTQQIYKNK